MFANLQVVGGNGVPHPLGPVLLLAFYGIDGVGDRTLCDRIGEDTLFLLTVVQTEGRTDMEVLQRIDVDIGIAKQAPVGVTVVGITVETCHWVLAVGITTYGTGIVTVDGADGQRGVELQHILEETARGSHLAGAVKGEVLTYGNHVEVLDLQQFEFGIHTSRDTVEV